MKIQTQSSWFERTFCFTHTLSRESVSGEPLPVHKKQDVSLPEYNEKQDI